MVPANIRSTSIMARRKRSSRAASPSRPI
jgi:hypothetical protein